MKKRKNIEIDEKLNKENERLEASKEEKEDLGLFLLMQQVDRNEPVSREAVMDALD